MLLCQLYQYKQPWESEPEGTSILKAQKYTQIKRIWLLSTTEYRVDYLILIVFSVVAESSFLLPIHMEFPLVG